MVSLGHLFLFTSLSKASCLQYCSFLTENGWLSVDPANWICFKYYNKPSSWWDAARHCEQQGLFLARPDNEGINAFIERKITRRTEHFLWIGGINQEDRGWKWTNGDKMDFTDFNPLTKTANRIISLFKKTTSCAMSGSVEWVMRSCDDLAPYLCQSGRNTTPPIVGPSMLSSRVRFSDSSTKFCEPARKAEPLRFNSSTSVCFVFFEDRSNWWDANKSCQEQNMSLVVVSNWDIDSTLFNLRELLIMDFWIGAINKDNAGWKWGNGHAMVYTNFDGLRITWDRIFKQTLCGVFSQFGWAKQGCDNLYPYMCQFYSSSSITFSKHVELQKQMAATNPNSTITTSKTAKVHEETTPASSSKAGATNTKENKQKTFKVKKEVGGRLHPKLIHSGQRNLSASNMVHCCRICSFENGCELVNFCKISRSCVLYGNFDAAVSGGLSSEIGCSVYVDVEKVD